MRRLCIGHCGNDQLEYGVNLDFDVRAHHCEALKTQKAPFTEIVWCFDLAHDNDILDANPESTVGVISGL